MSVATTAGTVTGTAEADAGSASHESAGGAEHAVTSRAWVRVCTLDQILPDTGVAALVGGHQVAVFRLRDDRLLAIANHDPCSGANVLARGIVGDVDGTAVVASPIHKQRFELATGACLDAETRVATFPVRLRDDVVEVARPRASGTSAA